MTSGRGHLFLNQSVPDAPDPGRLARVLPDGTIPWNVHDAAAVTPPVIGGDGLVVVGTPSAVEAYDLDSGDLVWSQPAGGLVNDLLLGDGGLAYALVGPLDDGELLVLDQRTGAELFRIVDVPAAWEMILQEGTIYAVGPGSSRSRSLRAAMMRALRGRFGSTTTSEPGIARLRSISAGPARPESPIAEVSTPDRERFFTRSARSSSRFRRTSGT
ncbi:MAG: PQQ-binding-like beta-propeller repeat protein [Candidatus Binatia bacterium]